jgi:ribosomal protein S18 acetylase RimI-like enzyme
MEPKIPYSFHWLSGVEMPLANKFYRKHGFRGKAKRNDICAVIKDSQKLIVASANIRIYKEFKLLAGVAVDSAYRRQGIARMLIEQMSVRFDNQTFTFPYEPLLIFYDALGFKLIESNRVASEVSDLFLTYLKQGRRISLMRFNT